MLWGSMSLDFLKSGANVIITYVDDIEVKSLESKLGDFKIGRVTF